MIWILHTLDNQVTNNVLQRTHSWSAPAKLAVTTTNALLKMALLSADGRDIGTVVFGSTVNPKLLWLVCVLMNVRERRYKKKCKTSEKAAYSRWPETQKKFAERDYKEVIAAKFHLPLKPRRKMPSPFDMFRCVSNIGVGGICPKKKKNTELTKGWLTLLYY